MTKVKNKETFYCLNCNKKLTGKQRKYCSQKCNKKYNKEKIKKYRKYNKEKRKEHYQNNKEKSKKYYEDNKEYNKEKRKEYYQNNKEKFQDWKLSLGCKLCHKKIKKSYYIDLHHHDPKEKQFQINYGIYHSALKGNEKSIKEIIKTIPLCAFCHRDVTSWDKNDERHKKLKRFTIKREEIV